MNSKTELKVFKLLVALIPYILVPILMAISEFTWRNKIIMLVVFLGPMLARDIKDGSFKV